MKIKELIKKLENQKSRSKWDKGVVNYSIMILEKIQDDYDHINGDVSFRELETLLLNGTFIQGSFLGLTQMLTGLPFLSKNETTPIITPSLYSNGLTKSPFESR